MDTKKEVITKAIESHLQEKYGEEFEVLSWNQPKLLPSDNGAIYATCIAKSDPKHPFEGSYFYPEEKNAKIEVIDDGYAERLLAKQKMCIRDSNKWAGNKKCIPGFLCRSNAEEPRKLQWYPATKI